MASPAQYSAQHNLPPHLAPYTYHFPSSPYSSPHHSSSYPTLPTSASYGYGRGDLPSDRQVYCFASDALFEGIIAHVTQFSNLTELIFHNAHLPMAVYRILECFPLLENLFFYDCFLPVKFSGSVLSPNPPDGAAMDASGMFDPGVGVEPLALLPTAPIQRLAIWNVRNEPDHMPHTPSSFRYALRLLRLPALRVLHIDWTIESAAQLRNLSKAGQLSPALKELAIRMPPQYLWPADLNVARTRLVDPLVAFLGSPAVSGVTCLEMVNRLPVCPVVDGGLPNLRTYSGPHTSVLDIATYRDLQHVEFKDEDRKTLDVISLLPDLKNASPGLRSLSVPLRRWDEEILYPSTDFWPMLRKLKITYEEGHPSEVSVIF